MYDRVGVTIENKEQTSGFVVEPMETKGKEVNRNLFHSLRRSTDSVDETAWGEQCLGIDFGDDDSDSCTKLGSIELWMLVTVKKKCSGYVYGWIIILNCHGFLWGKLLRLKFPQQKFSDMPRFTSCKHVFFFRNKCKIVSSCLQYRRIMLDAEKCQKQSEHGF